MFNWFLQNFRTLGLALIMAIAVWMSAVSAADPDEVRTFPRQIPLEIVGQDPSLTIVGTVPKQVSLVLRAPRSVWEQLIASDGQVRAVIDLAGLAAGEHELTTQLQIRNQPVKVISVTPETVNLTLEPLTTKTFSVAVVLSGEAAVGYQAGIAQFEPAEVLISGPQSLLDQIKRVEAQINLTGLRDDFQASIDLKALDSIGRSITGVSIAPAGVAVNLPITQRGGYRDIAVKVNVRGQVAGGYRLTNISVFPPVLTVFSSDPALVNDLPGFVETEALNLNGASQNIETRLNLVLPAGVSVVGAQTVIVQVGISAIEGSLSLSNLPVTMMGLSSGLKAEIAPATVDIILSGPLPLLDKLAADDIIITVDLTGLKAGVHQVEAQIELSIDDIHVQTINPTTIEVTISASSP